MIKKLIEKLLGGKGEYRNFITEINRLEPELEKLGEQELKDKSNDLKKTVRENEQKLNEFGLICVAFGLVR